MLIIEYLYITLSIILLIDLIYAYIQMHIHYDLVLLYGITSTSKIKLWIETINTILFIVFLILKFIVKI